MWVWLRTNYIILLNALRVEEGGMSRSNIFLTLVVDGSTGANAIIEHILFFLQSRGFQTLIITYSKMATYVMML